MRVIQPPRDEGRANGKVDFGPRSFQDRARVAAAVREYKDALARGMGDELASIEVDHDEASC